MRRGRGGVSSTSRPPAGRMRSGSREPRVADFAGSQVDPRPTRRLSASRSRSSFHRRRRQIPSEPPRSDMLRRKYEAAVPSDEPRPAQRAETHERVGGVEVLDGDHGVAPRQAFGEATDQPVPTWARSPSPYLQRTRPRNEASFAGMPGRRVSRRGFPTSAHEKAPARKSPRRSEGFRHEHEGVSRCPSPSPTRP